MLQVMSTVLRHPRVSSVALFGLLVLLFAGRPGAAVEESAFGFETTGDLYAVCATAPEDPDHVVARIACHAFIEATVQYHDGIASPERLAPLICYPPGTTIDDGRTAFVAWAEANRSNAQWLGELPVAGLVRALAQAYPCE